MRTFGFNRRHFLGSTFIGASSLALGGLLSRRAKAAEAALGRSRKFIFAYFDGGWDILLGLDPRDPATTEQIRDQIAPAYGQLAAPYRTRGVQRAAGLQFGPSVPPEFLAHAAEVSIINGITMDTASHEAGRRYFITGRFPRGISAVGSSTTSEIVAQIGDESPIPHLSVGVESYATSLPPYASALSVNSIADLSVALTPFFRVDPQILAAVERYQDEAPGCEGKRLDRDGLVTSALRNQKRARSYIQAELNQIFDLTRSDAEMTRLRDLYAIGADVNAPGVLAFIAAQAIKKNVSQCASVRITDGLDTHSNWAQDQAPRQELGWRGLASIISDLKATPSIDDPGKSVFDETTIVAFSEFGRSPLFNNIQGRDHFLGNSCLVAGAGIQRGLTVGRSAAVGMLPIDTDLLTGAGIERPTEAQRQSGDVAILTPKHVIATILASRGLAYDYLRTPPIRALLRA